MRSIEAFLFEFHKPACLGKKGFEFLGQDDIFSGSDFPVKTEETAKIFEFGKTQTQCAQKESALSDLVKTLRKWRLPLSRNKHIFVIMNKFGK